MSKVVWILVLLLMAVLFVKPLRERARPQIEFVLNPVYKWDAKNRVNEIYRVMERERSQGVAMPRPRDFQKFLTDREGPNAAVDPWGVPFYLHIGKRSMRVSSAGPDRVAGTADDIHSKPEPLEPAAR